MATTKQYFTRIPSGGFDRSAAPHACPPNTWYDLLNFKPLPGRLLQTAPFVSKFALTVGLGYSTDFLDLVRDKDFNLRYLVLNQKNLFYVDPTNTATQVNVPFVTQDRIPNNITVNGQCLLYGINTTDFAADGDTIDIVIDGATTFKWRRNAGAYTTLVPITTNVAIGANGLKVGFLATTGFTVADAWRWSRADAGGSAGGGTAAAAGVYSKAQFGSDNYISSPNGGLIRVRNNFVNGVGYKRIFGKYVAVFQNHLLVGHFREATYSGGAPVDSYVAATTPFVLGWSDLNNPDCFFSTPVNEAGTYNIPNNRDPEHSQYGITGMGLLNRSFLVYTASGMSTVDYVGLPNVFQTLPAYNVGCAFPGALVITPDFHYFISQDQIYRCNGNAPVAIGEPVRTKFFGEIVAASNANWPLTTGYYDAANQEVIWRYAIGPDANTHYQWRDMVYMEKYNRWYFRNVAYFSTGTPLALCRTYNDPTRLLVGGFAEVLGDLNAEAATAILPDNVTVAGNTYTNPYAETNDLFYEQLFSTKECDGIYMDATWVSGSAKGIKTEFSIRNSLSVAPVMQDCGVLWQPNTDVDARIGLPRAAGRIYRLRFTGYGTKPVGVTINAWGETIYSKGAER